MKKILYPNFLFLLFIPSNAQKKSVHKASSTLNRMMIPNMTKDDIKIPSLDDLIAAENKKILEQTKDSTQLINRNSRGMGFEQNGFIGGYDKEGKLSRMLKNIYVKDSFLEERGLEEVVKIWVSFYPNNKVHSIIQESSTFLGYYPVGNWYLYAPDGKLLKHVNFENKFRMSLCDVVKIADFYRDDYQYSGMSVSRTFNGKGTAYWVISLRPIQGQSLEHKQIIIDDKTGKVLYQMSREEFAGFQKLQSMFQDVRNLLEPFRWLEES